MAVTQMKLDCRPPPAVWYSSEQAMDQYSFMAQGLGSPVLATDLLHYNSQIHWFII